jgi:arabinose-5-phosphate isomerase
MISGPIPSPSATVMDTFCIVRYYKQKEDEPQRKMLKTLFEKQKKSIDQFFVSLDVIAAEKVLEKVRSCSGVVLLTGVGKSGHVAQKISATMVSTGTRASFLCPLHALHGDLGFVSANDLFLMFSKSGESQELLDLLPYIQRKGAYSIAIVSQESSRLAKQANMSMVLPVDEELCPFDLAPTISTTVQMLFGDCLAIALMQSRKFSVEDFALNHPAGFLGRKITMKVVDLMLKKEHLPLCKQSDLLIDSLHELSAKKCGCLLVCDDQGSLRGIFTDGDLRRAIQINGPQALQLSLSQLMTAAPLTVSSHLLVYEAMGKMEADPTRLVTALPVVENGELIGLLRMHDIVQAGMSR